MGVAYALSHVPLPVALGRATRGCTAMPASTHTDALPWQVKSSRAGWQLGFFYLPLVGAWTASLTSIACVRKDVARRLHDARRAVIQPST